MGTDALLVAVGEPAATARALRAGATRLAELEARWSRFLTDSDLGRLRRAAGRPVVVAAETAALVAAAVDAWHTTGGRFDPTVLAALERLGYDRTFARVGRRADADTPLLDGGPDPAPGCDGIVVDLAAASVTLPAGVALDLGGIGKGRAADLVAELIVAEGARGALVDLGGDVRVLGRPPGDAWHIAVDPPFGESADPLAVLSLRAGAVVTTARTRRRWRRDGVEQHHLIDPATGLPVRSGLASVTVLAAEALAAEVVATAAFVAGPVAGAELVAVSGAAGLLVTDDGEVLPAGPVEEFLR